MACVAWKCAWLDVLKRMPMALIRGLHLCATLRDVDMDGYKATWVGRVMKGSPPGLTKIWIYQRVFVKGLANTQRKLCLRKT